MGREPESPLDFIAPDPRPPGPGQCAGACLARSGRFQRLPELASGDSWKQGGLPSARPRWAAGDTPAVPGRLPCCVETLWLLEM